MDTSLLINVLITLLVYGVLFWAVGFIAARIPGIPGFIVTLIQVVLGVALVIYLLRLLGVFATGIVH